MSRINVARSSGVSPFVPHEAGANQALSAEQTLERLVSCCLLGEDQFYLNGQSVQTAIAEVAKQVKPEFVVSLAVKARLELGLRHVPLLLLTLTLDTDAGRNAIRKQAAPILRTPKDAMDLLALYWRAGKRPVPHVFKQLFRQRFAVWSDYQIQKYGTLSARVSVRLRDVLRLCHADPRNFYSNALADDRNAITVAREALFKSLTDDTIRAPDTWESALSAAGPDGDKRAIWERLLAERKLGALALVRNLRNMEAAGVTPALVIAAMETVKAGDVWPWQALAAAREAPTYTHALDALMLRSAGSLPRLPGHTGVLVDVSGSMDHGLSTKGTMKRMDAGAGLAVVLNEVCEASTIASFSESVVLVSSIAIGKRGAGLASDIVRSQPHGRTYLAQAVETFLRCHPIIDRLVILTDEQAQDHFTSPPNLPVYVVNLASTERGMNMQQKVTRINGWSGNVIRWLAQDIAGTIGQVGDGSEED
jgi:hypothetical protein